MNWRYILGIGITGGLILGIGRAIGLNQWFVFPAMAAVLVIAAAIIGSEKGEVGLNGFLTGCMIGLVQSTVIMVFLDPLARFSGLAHDFQRQTGIGAELLLWLMVLAAGLFWGMVLAMASWCASIIIERLVGKDSPEG